jgi:hypothetical protein
MVDFSAKRTKERKLLTGVVALSLAVVMLVWIAARANRPATEEDKPAGTAAGEPTAVRLDRPELAQAAGIEVEPVQSRAVESTITCNGSAGFNQNKYVQVPPKADGTLAKDQRRRRLASARGERSGRGQLPRPGRP